MGETREVTRGDLEWRCGCRIREIPARYVGLVGESPL